MGWLLILMLALLVLAAWPSWPYSRGWGYWPSGVVATILFVAVLMMAAAAL